MFLKTIPKVNFKALHIPTKQINNVFSTLSIPLYGKLVNLVCIRHNVTTQCVCAIETRVRNFKIKSKIRFQTDRKKSFF